MVHWRERTVIGVIVGGDEGYGTHELAARAGVSVEALISMVEEGVLQPAGRAPAQWQFVASDLERVRAVLRIQHDLGLNLAGAALALELHEELRRLQNRVRLLEKLLDF